MKNKNEPLFTTVEEKIPSIMNDWGVHGSAVAIIKDDEIIYSDGFGYRDYENKYTADCDTVFAIGSASKAFTTTSMGILVDRGLLDWDKPVREYLPDFRMWDSFASDRITPRDLVCHRSGLPDHNMPWFGSDATRADLVHQVRYLEPNTDFRTKFHYQNLMFVVAGYLVEQITGKTWEQFVQAEILDSLGMKNTNFSVEESKKRENAAKPYQFIDGQIKEMQFANIDSVGPAGSINSTVNDMVQWVKLQLGNGCVDGKQIISPENLQIIHSPNMVIGNDFMPPLNNLPGLSLDTYGLGWFIQGFRGHRLIHHGGHINGFGALISFMPSINAGVVFLANDNRTLFIIPPSFAIYDHLLQMGPQPWNEWFLDIQIQLEQSRDKERINAHQIRQKQTKTSLSLDQFAGKYKHPGYGELIIKTNGDALICKFNNQDIALSHFHFDVFEGYFESEGVDYYALFQFKLDALGMITGVEVPFDSSIPPIFFEKKD